MRLSDAQLAVAAVGAGADVVRARYGSALAPIEKSSTDFATEADLESERVIKALLRAERPADAFFGEESGRAGPASAARTWLVDPLCGTLNYAARTLLAAVNVALQSGGRMTVAACADPFVDEVFWTDGDQAFVRREAQAAYCPSRSSRIRSDLASCRRRWLSPGWLRAAARPT
jgi:myo-inositol-1(or 4)-monophosphatase